MKNLFFILFFLSQTYFAYATFITPAKSDRNKLAKSELTVSSVSKMNFRQFRKYTNLKSGFKNRMAFLLLKKELKEQVKAGNGDMNIAPVLSDMIDDARFRFKLIGFAAGLLLGIFGVGLTYLITKDRNVHRSAWIGFSLLVVIAVVSLFSIFPG